MSVTTLPDEMLAEIFEHCVEGVTGEPGGEGLGVSPRILALVSRNWYRVALATASLWRRILVTDAIYVYWQIKQNRILPRMSGQRYIPRESPGNTGAYTRSATQVCETQAQLESALQRTRGTSLDITIAFTNSFPWNPGKTSPHHGLYEVLFNDRITPRITRLAFDGRGMPPMEESSFAHVSIHMHLLSNLVSLTYLGPHADRTTEENSIIRLILENSRNLKELFLGDTIPYCLSGEIWPNAGYDSAIRNLQRLGLTTESLERIFRHVVSHPIAELAVQEAAQIAAEIEDGNEMSVPTLYTRPWPNRFTQEITFTRITRIHLILDDVSLLSRVHFPALEHLRLTQSWQCRQIRTFGDIQPFLNPKFSLTLPKLRSLRIMAHQFAPLSQFHVPQLESLHITSNLTMRRNTDTDFSILFPSPPTSITPSADGSKSALVVSSFHALQSIHTLHVNADVSEELLLQALRSLSKLRVLSLVPGKELGLALVQGLTVEKRTDPSKPESILCPDLRVIQLDLVSFIEWDRRSIPGVRVGTSTLEGFPSILDECISSRRNAGIPLQSCTVTDSLGKREYVGFDV